MSDDNKWLLLLGAVLQMESARKDIERFDEVWSGLAQVENVAEMQEKEIEHSGFIVPTSIPRLRRMVSRPRPYACRRWDNCKTTLCCCFLEQTQRPPEIEQYRPKGLKQISRQLSNNIDTARPLSKRQRLNEVRSNASASYKT